MAGAVGFVAGAGVGAGVGLLEVEVAVGAVRGGVRVG